MAYHKKGIDTMDNKSSSTGSGIGICTVLFIVFLILKLTGTITWPWIWVCAPLWIPAAFALACLAIILLITVLFNR